MDDDDEHRMWAWGIADDNDTNSAAIRPTADDSNDTPADDTSCPPADDANDSPVDDTLADEANDTPAAGATVSSADDASDATAEAPDAAGIDKTRTGRRRVYTNKFKMSVVDSMLAGANATTLAKSKGITCRTSIYGWVKNEAKIREACANKKRSKVCVGGQGRPIMFEHEDEIVQWIKDMRREDFPLKTSHVVAYMVEEFDVWVTQYNARNKSESLLRLVQRLIQRRGFSFKKPNRTLLSTEDLLREQDAYVNAVATSINATYTRDCIFNADETGVYYEEDTGPVIAEKGSKTSTRVWGRKWSSRVTILLTVDADGRKLRPLIIFKGEPMGTIKKEFGSYPTGAVYAVQTNAWMNGDVWQASFIEDLWSDYIDSEQPGPLVIYVDNFKCHTSNESINAFAQLGTEVASLPKNTTAVLQPLDVGVMGPFKQKLRALALSDDLQRLRGAPELTLRERLLMSRKKTAAESRLEVAVRVIRAWNSVSEASVVRAWQKSRLISE